jgi:hypothetical protein
MIRLKMFAIAFFTLIIIASMAHGQTTRPIEDFVDTQGTFCIDTHPGGGRGAPQRCMLFVPPVANFFGQSDPNGLLSSVDYAGLADEWIQGPDGCGMSFDTTFSGTVTETALADGRAAVHVVLHTENALTWVTDGGDFNNPLLFGHRAPDVCQGAEPALGAITFIIDFINSAPGAPLPDLFEIAFGASPPGTEFPFFLSTRARAEGPLRPAFGVEDGTPGRFNTTQNGLFMTGAGGATADGFPVERINLTVVGEGRHRRGR